MNMTQIVTNHMTTDIMTREVIKRILESPAETMTPEEAMASVETMTRGEAMTFAEATTPVEAVDPARLARSIVV